MSHAHTVTQLINVPKPLCIRHLLKDQAERIPDALAIVAPGRAPLTYGHLRVHVDNIAQTLHAMGLGCNDRVALVLPNGPEMAVAFLAVATSATCAPLNPAYGANEFDQYLAELNARALILQADMDSPARAIAQARGICIIELLPMLEAEAGIFTLMGEVQTCLVHRKFTSPGDVALVLHTSGTTSQPKIVPLTHANVCTSAYNTCMALALVESDRCLNVMPLFHSHGLLGTLLPSLVAGASIVCTPGFYASQFFVWMTEFRPTWYTAVPTIHQELLAHTALNQEMIARCPLRFIRSGSASLPLQVLAELERVFHAPVIECYGMTETASQVTCNPLPPRQRKPGSVGVAVGTEVAIMDEADTLLPVGTTGEIVICGSNVMQGYDGNPAANRSAFTYSWFRTGDQGYLDPDGYLFITGRLKEIINRGGEKIAPREVDDVLMDHPAVVRAVTFAVPHARLGEEVAAAVILHQDASATASDIRQFAAMRLAAFKVPRQVLILDDLPKSPTGKLQRFGLAEKLGLTALEQAQIAMQAGFTAPRTPVEEMLARLWAEVLNVECVGIHDSFFDIGGDSLRAMSLFAAIEQVTGKKLPPAILLQAPTVSQLAHILCQAEWSTSRSLLVPIQPVGSKPPLFCLPGHIDNVLMFRDLARYLGREQPVYGLQAQRLEGERGLYTPIEEIATRYIQEILTVQPQGPFFLVGFCFGGLVAFEVAQQLHRQGHEGVLPILVETYRPYPSVSSITASLRFRGESVRLFMFHLANLAQFRPKKLIVYLGEAVKRRIKKRLLRIEHRWYQLFGRILPPALRKVEDNHMLAVGAYTPQVYPGRVLFFLDSETPVKGPHNPVLAWGELAAGGLEVHRVPGKWVAIFQEPHVQGLAEQLRLCLDQAQARCQRI